MLFSPQVEATLRKSGWYPNRQLSISEIEPWCVFRDGAVPLIIFPKAYESLAEYGGLKIICGDETNPYILNFDPTLSQTGWFEYGWIWGQPFFPLGISYSQDDEDNAALLGIDTLGQIWAVAHEPYFISQNIQEAIGLLVSGSHNYELAETNYRKADEASQLFAAITRQMFKEN